MQVNMPDGNLLTTADGQQWRLLQFHFHTPSENALDGRHSPMEAHLVHQNVKTGVPMHVDPLPFLCNSCAYSSLYSMWAGGCGVQQWHMYAVMLLRCGKCKQHAFALC
jgi:Eukaryotic-type carbonic anhydrase